MPLSDVVRGKLFPAVFKEANTSTHLLFLTSSDIIHPQQPSSNIFQLHRQKRKLLRGTS